MDLIRQLEQQGGVARMGTLTNLGHSKREIARAADTGVVHRPRKGIIALPNAPAAYLQAICSNAKLSCLSAADEHRLWTLLPPERLHLASSHNRMPKDCVAHRKWGAWNELPRPVAALPEVLYHALHCLPPLQSLVMIESAVGRADISLEFLRDRMTGPRNGPARWVLERVEQSADSLIETLARVLFRDAGITVRTQVRIDGVGYVDFLLEDFLIIELDGLTHLEKRQFKKDRRRDNLSLVQGYLSLHYFYEDIVYNRDATLAQIRQVLHGGVRSWR